MSYRRYMLAFAVSAAVIAFTISALTALSAGAAQRQPVRSAASAAKGARAQSQPATCLIHSLPSFTAQGELKVAATVADIIEVECNPTVYGTESKIKITASQLFNGCKGHLTWFVPNPFKEVKGTLGVTVELDADGNATVAVLAGPGCTAGESLISAHMQEEPFESFTTSFTVLPPANTAEGVFALPGSQVEDAGSSAVATIIEAEFPGGSEKKVRIGSDELFARCRREPHVRWIRMDGTIEAGTEGATAVELDNNGNAFVIAVGDSSCAEGTSLIEADLESKPFTTFTNTFTVLPPQPTEEPAFTIEKLQQIAGGAGGFTTSPLTGAIGQTVQYEIVVRNTAKVAETFTNFTDPHCDPGTIAGGPGANPVPGGQSTTYTCHHVLSAVGPYTNEATVTGNSVGGTPLTQTSNQVVVEAPPPVFTIEKLQKLAGASGGYTVSPLTGAVGQVVEYEIIVNNTGIEPLVLSKFTDAHCDPGTVVGPTELSLPTGASATFTCGRALTGPGSYLNEAAVTGTAPGAPPLSHRSNQVEVNVPAAQTGALPVNAGGKQIVKSVTCEASSPVLLGASGSKSTTFVVQVTSRDIRQVTFYLDGRKLRKLVQSEARGGKYTITINPRKLAYGGHKVLIKTLPSSPNCSPTARSAAFVRPRPPQVVVKFTG